MHRYRSLRRGLLISAAALSLTACALPSARENVDAAAVLVSSQSRAALEWRRDPAADDSARKRAAILLEGGVTLEESVAVAFLTHPGLQIALEQLAISRAQLVAATTPPNPVAIIGSRKPGGDLAAFYPERSLSFGVLQNVIALLNIPDRMAIARHDLERVRFETAQLAVTHAAEVVEAWLGYAAALQSHALHERHQAAVARETGNDPRQEAMLLAADELIRSDLERASTRGRLGELMGVTGWRDDWQVLAQLPEAPDTDPPLASLESAAMQRRLDLQAGARAVAARLRVLATQRRFRWLNQLEFGVFRDKAIGGTAFTGPNVVVEIPVFDQRHAALLQTDAELRIAMRQLEAASLAARTTIRLHAAELQATRRQLQQYALQTSDTEQSAYVGLLREYWRARSALALAAGDWTAFSGL